tara:strand:+ start:357 stop:704 length:348 start_codon:yes stop_codon:yes gene_type:complete
LSIYEAIDEEAINKSNFELKILKFKKYIKLIIRTIVKCCEYLIHFVGLKNQNQTYVDNIDPIRGILIFPNTSSILLLLVIVKNKKRTGTINILKLSYEFHDETSEIIEEVSRPTL